MADADAHTALLAQALDLRRDVGRMLHNDIAQTLTLATLYLKRLPTDPTVAGATTAALAALDEAMDQLRTLTVALHPSLLDQVGLAAALRLYAESVLGRAVAVEATPAADALADAPRRAAYWLGQGVLGAAPRASGLHLDATGGRVTMRLDPVDDIAPIDAHATAFGLSARADASTAIIG